VRCSITGYGSSGPKAAQPGYDFILQAESGLMSICGEPDGEPTKYGVAIVDVCTGMLACNSILAALNARNRTGKGQKVEVSLYESSLAMLVNVASNYLAPASRADVSATAIRASCRTPLSDRRRHDRARGGQRRAVRPVRGGARTPGMGTDARFIQNRARSRTASSSIGLVAEALKAMQPTRGSPSCRRLECRADASIRSRRRSKTRRRGPPHGRNRRASTDRHAQDARHPFKFSDTPTSVRLAPPTLGQPTDEVLHELGMDAAQIAALRQDKVV
jgi:crotonobetainyl-CoA:carnitine CoA-transferase CaiB-like acyl-CoA transferase